MEDLGLMQQSQLVNRGPVALANLPPLSPHDYHLLISFLGSLLSQEPDPNGRRVADSADGRFRLMLEDPPLATYPAVITTAGGTERLAIPAYTLTVRSAATRATDGHGCKPRDAIDHHAVDVSRKQPAATWRS